MCEAMSLSCVRPRVKPSILSVLVSSGMVFKLSGQQSMHAGEGGFVDDMETAGYNELTSVCKAFPDAPTHILRW